MASFEQQLKDVARRFDKRAELFVKRVVSGVAQNVIEMSPVGDALYWSSPAPKGYVGGRFRANWDYGFNRVPRQTYTDIDKSGSVSLSRINSGIGSNTYGIHYIINNLPYSQRLENGWSRQAPQGMVKLTAMKWQSFIKDALR